MPNVSDKELKKEANLLSSGIKFESKEHKLKNEDKANINDKKSFSSDDDIDITKFNLKYELYIKTMKV